MSRAQRCALVEREDTALPVSQQCRLLAVSRSSIYRRPPGASDGDRTMMALIDRQYLARPYYGSRRMRISKPSQARPQVSMMRSGGSSGGVYWCEQVSVMP